MVVQPEPLADVAKAAADLQRGRGEDDAIFLKEEVLLEQRPDLERRRAQGHAPLAHGHPAHVVWRGLADDGAQVNAHLGDLAVHAGKIGQRVVDQVGLPLVWLERFGNAGDAPLQAPQRRAEGLPGCLDGFPSLGAAQRRREPDIALYAVLHPTQRDYGVWKELTPVLVVEVVSPGQEDRDYEEKRDEYLRAGVREYWIVDPEAQRFTALHREADAWRESVLPPPDAYETPALPGLNLDVRRILLLDP